MTQIEKQIKHANDAADAGIIRRDNNKFYTNHFAIDVEHEPVHVYHSCGFGWMTIDDAINTFDTDDVYSSELHVIKQIFA